MTTAVKFEDVERHDLVDGGDQDLPAGKRERLVRRLEIGIAHCVEDDVSAFAVGEFPDAGLDVGGARVDDFDRSGSGGVALIVFILANDANDPGAAPAGKLRRSLA